MYQESLLIVAKETLIQGLANQLNHLRLNGRDFGFIRIGIYLSVFLKIQQLEMKEAFNTLGVSGVWIIEKDSGLTILCYEPTPKIKGFIFGGMLIAIRGLMTEIQIGQLSSISTDTHDLTLTISENLVCAIILEKGSSTEYLFPLLTRISEEAEKLYLEMRNAVNFVDADFFSQFNSTLEELTVSHVEFIQKHSKTKVERTDKAEKKLEKSGLW